MKSFTLNKNERLKSKKEISRLFDDGKFLFSDCFKLIWTETGFFEKYPAKIVVSVPKRIHKKAVTRNLLKRRLREAYRLNKNILYENLRKKEKSINFMIVYNCKNIFHYKQIENNIISLLNELIELELLKSDKL